nr:uncharacterized protein LOC111512356 [Leptinotarsa decemlineata]
MLMKFVGIYVTCIIFQNVRGAEEKIETSCNINLKKSIQCVSEKFLSFSIDPAVLLAGVNLSETSLRLAQHLSPAYIRIAGPSTSFVNYVDKDDRFANYLSEDGNSVIVTPSMWFGINEWFKLANLMPVYGINDIDTEAGNWNPKSVLPLLEISDKLNVSCYWQLGFDSTNKTEMIYEQDLNILHDVLEGFTERNETWKIVGSDISQFPADRTEKMMVELKDVVTAVMWEPPHITEDTFPEKDMSYKILQRNSRPNVKIWTTAPKPSETVIFSSVLLWAKQIGNAAKTGYDVVFRQPRMHELFSDTPVYWFSLLHKKLMGSNVLEARTTSNRAGTNIFAHCTRKQNSFVRRGALTVMIVNDNPETYMVKVKLGTTPHEKSMEVQMYILTAPELNSTQVFLNGKPLTSEMLKEKNIFEPKVRRAKTTSHLSLSLPAWSVGFFVLPGARVPVCIDQEIETKLLLEEMEENQNIPLSEEVALKFGSRGSFVKNHVLDEMTKKMKQEMMSDERYYSHPSLKSRLEDSEEMESAKKEKIDERGRKFFIDRAKLAEKHKKHRDFERKRDELKKFLMERSKTGETKPKMESKGKEIHLTSSEVEKILKDRARARAARRNIVFTDEELRALVHKASKKFYKARIKRSTPFQNRAKRDINVRMLERTVQLNPSCEKLTEGQQYDNEEISRNSFVREPRDVNAKLVELKAKLAETKSKWEDKKDEFRGNTKMARESIKDRIRKLKDKKRFKRDINMELLDVKSKPTKKMEMEKRRQKKKKTEMEATIREPGQSSAELLEQLEFERGQLDNHRKQPKHEVYAELADSEDLEAEEFFKTTPKPKRLKIFDKKSKLDPFGIPNPSIDIVEPPFRRSKKGRKKSKSKSDNLQFLTSSEEFSDIEDDLPCIHEYFGPETKSERKKHGNVMTELGEFSSAEKLKRKKNRKTKNFSEETSSEEDSRRRKRSVYLEPYNPNESSESKSRLEYLDSFLEKMNLKCSECGNQQDYSNEKGDDDRIERPKRSLYLRNGLQNPAELIRDLNEHLSEEGSESAEIERQKRNVYLTEGSPDSTEFIEGVDGYTRADIKLNEESERFKRGMFLGKESKDSTKLIKRVNELETLLEDLEQKYKECMSQRNDQFGMKASHSSKKELNNDMTPTPEYPLI